MSEILTDTIVSVNTIINTNIWYVAFAVVIVLGIIFTIRGRGVQLHRIPEAIRLLKSSVKEKIHSDSISSFQAFCTTMGTRVGIGNIAGIAAAIVMGGPGSIFWMWIFVIILAAVSFVENTMGQIYKEKQSDGFTRGGPAYYIKNGLGKPKFAIIMSVLLVTLAFSYCGVQANQACASVVNTFPVLSPLLVGAVITLAAGFIFFGGVKRIAKISAKIVPFMLVGYLAIVVIVLLTNLQLIGGVFETIFAYAFGIRPFLGGGFAMMFIWALKRSVFSTDSGVGIIPNISSSAKVSHPVKVGLIQALGTFVDILICTASGLVILLYTNQVYPNYNFTELGLSAAELDSLKGAPLVSDALSSTFLGPAAPFILTIFLLTFAFSTLISHYFTCEANISYITQKPIVMKIVRILLIVSVFIFSQLSLGVVWDITDTVQAVLCICNLAALIFLSKYAFEALRDYFKQKKDGVKEPVFTADVLSNGKGVTCWDAKREDEGK